jgi:hypothetical protein
MEKYKIIHIELFRKWQNINRLTLENVKFIRVAAIFFEENPFYSSLL